MTRPVHNVIPAIMSLTLMLSPLAWGQTVRLTNGSAVQGSVTGITDEGLQVKTPTGVRTFTWDSLAASTRFRYQAFFRANYDAVVRGIPRARWSNAPDPVFERELSRMVESGGQASAPGQTAPPTAAPAASSAPALIFEDITYAQPAPLEASSFPNASFRNLDYASFIAFQYGTSATDVLYMAFDAPGPSDMADILYVFSPGAAEFAKTVQIKGFKRGSGADRRCTYRKIRVQAVYGKTPAVIEFEPETGGIGTNELFLTINVDLNRDRTRSNFDLARRFTDLQHGAGVIAVHGILDMPNLWVGARTSGGSAEALLLLSMSNMPLIPRDGMDTRAALTVTGDAGEVVYRDSVKMNLFPPPLDGIAAPLRRVTAGKTYSLTATMNLGPFLGNAEASGQFVMPR